MSISGAPAAPHGRPNTTPNLYCALSEPQWPQQANSHVTACKTAHVCIDAQAYRRVAEVDSQIKYQTMEFYAVLRHFVSLSVSLRIANRLQYLAMYLKLWCPHTGMVPPVGTTISNTYVKTVISGIRWGYVGATFNHYLCGETFVWRSCFVVAVLVR